MIPKGPYFSQSSELNAFLTAVEGIGYIWDLETDQMTWFGPIQSYFKSPPETGDQWNQHIHPDDLVARTESLNFHFKGGLLMTCEYRVLFESGGSYWFREFAQANSEPGNAPSFVIGLLHYDHAYCQYKKDLENLSHKDPLTGLFNKFRFCQSLEQSLLYSHRYKISSSYLVLAIDHLDMLNITYGAAAVNDLICQIAQDLQKFIRPTDIVGRISGNVYGIIVEHCDEEEILGFAHNLNLFIQQKGFQTSSGALYTTISIGTVTFPQQGSQVADILARADTALTQAKRQGVGRIVAYNPYSSEEISQKHDMKLRGNVHQALVTDQILVYYQPVVTEDKALKFYECLSRLQTPEGEIIPAADFLPVVERFRMTRFFDIKILEKVVETLIQNPSLSLSVNLSRLTLNDSIWLDRLCGLLRENPSVGPRLIVEITETAALPSWERIDDFVKKIKDQGCAIALDDFGVGYTSFLFLKTLPVDLVKIDAAYVKGIQPGSTNMVFIRALMSLARGLGFKVLAEGIETDSDFRIMKEEGVDLFQGYYLGHPQKTLKG